jgi:hypothetical protein
MVSVDVEIIEGGPSGIEPSEIAIGGDIFSILRITDRWHDLRATYFKVAASNGYSYLLRRDLDTKSWSVEHIWQIDA